MHLILLRRNMCVAILSVCSLALSFLTHYSEQNASPVPDPIVIIAHKDVPEDILTASEVFDFYTLKNVTWSDGSLVFLFDLKTNTDQKKEFYQFLNTDSREMRQICNDLNFLL